MVAAWAAWRLALIALGLAGGAALGVVLGGAITDLICSLAFGIVMLALVHAMERLTGRFMMGGGDIKLLAAVSLFLGIDGILVALFAACLVSFLYAAAKLKRGIPFAPCILCGVLLAALII